MKYNNNDFLQWYNNRYANAIKYFEQMDEKQKLKLMKLSSLKAWSTIIKAIIEGKGGDL